MSKKLTIEEVEAKIDAKHSGAVKMISFGGTGKAMSKFRCAECGNIWETTAQHIYFTGTGCKICKNRKNGEKKRTSLDEVNRKIFERHNGKVLMFNYAGVAHLKSDFVCVDCGRKWKADAQEVYGQGTGCSVCKKKAADERCRSSEEEVVVRIKEKHGDSITMKSYGGSALSKSYFSCNCCGNEWSTTAQSLYLSGTGCKPCNIKKRGIASRISFDEISEKVAFMHGESVTLISLGVNVRSHSVFLCNSCNTHWNASASSVYGLGTGCPSCMVGSDADVFYIWETNEHSNLYKVGISSERVGDRRIKQVEKANGLTANIILHVVTNNARALERMALAMGEQPTFITGAGRTEFRYYTKSELKKIINAANAA
jgi:hypothetical protein